MVLLRAGERPIIDNMDESERQSAVVLRLLYSRRRQKPARFVLDGKRHRLRWLIVTAVCLYAVYILLRLCYWEQYSNLPQLIRGHVMGIFITQ